MFEGAKKGVAGLGLAVLRSFMIFLLVAAGRYVGYPRG